MTSEETIEAARVLAEELSQDIPKCATREEHIRVTARANAAAAIYNGLLLNPPVDPS
jgi:hypothetical protein